MPAGNWGRGREGRPHGGHWAPGFPAVLDPVPILQTRRAKGGEVALLLRAC